MRPSCDPHATHKPPQSQFCDIDPEFLWASLRQLMAVTKQPLSNHFMENNVTPSSSALPRRDFLKKTATAAAVVAAAPLLKTPVYGQNQAPSANVVGANNRIQVAIVGVGFGIGQDHLKAIQEKATENNTVITAASAADAAIGQADGVLVLGDKGERLRDGAGVCFGGAGGFADGVGEHFGVQAAQRVIGEIRRGFGASGAGNCGKLISLRIEYEAVDGLQIVMRCDQFLL